MLKQCRIVIVVTCCLILARGACVAAPNAGALGTKVVDMMEIQRVWDPVRITAVAVGEQRIETGLSGPRGEIKQGTPFQADEDWLKNMTISVRNRTDEPIVNVQILLWFPDTVGASPGKATTTYRLMVGQRIHEQGESFNRRNEFQEFRHITAWILT